ncbi:MAG: hypothetical protein NTU69_12535 [Proteobacteria bacterium]|nr:hypothetical protein [Pseudomonadota bacterium]
MSEKNCFVIAPIGEDNSDMRKHSDEVLEYIIKPVTKEFHYITIRSDQINKSGIITNQIIEHLLKDDLVIADLTGNNPNVFYELAVRHLIRKPFIQLTQVGQATPFDVSQIRNIEFTISRPSSVAECTEKLRKYIEEIEKNPDKIESPFTSFIDIQSLSSKEGNSLEKVVTALVQVLSNKLIPLQTELYDEIKSLLQKQDTLYSRPFGSTGPTGLAGVSELYTFSPLDKALEEKMRKTVLEKMLQEEKEGK